MYFRNFKGAAETIRENNALGAVCARVCPTIFFYQLRALPDIA
ncbi:hypothetical protein ACUOFC_07085, partial [Escherichia sp. TWPC-MK]